MKPLPLLTGEENSVAENPDPEKSGRLLSLDAYRGFIMLVMASSGFAIAKIAENEQITEQFADPQYGKFYETFWTTLSYQFSHVEWTGCSFWDLIQPSFMFMVGVSMPFSYSRRKMEGQSAIRRVAHVLFRSMILILLGVFLSSNGDGMTDFTFVNVLTQIGLGYVFVYALWRAPFVVQLLSVAAILGGYWYYFDSYQTPSAERAQVIRYIKDEIAPNDPNVLERGSREYSQFDRAGVDGGLQPTQASKWNKHLNAAAAADRLLLNEFPRESEPWEGKRFWVNRGGYQTLNFIPAIATMLFGVMAGRLLRSSRTSKQKLARLILAGGLCLVAGMAVDSSIWPEFIRSPDWHLAPIVKRIWSPGWAVYSTGWTFWMLAAFYWSIDMLGMRWLALPFAVVGVNSIAMYCMSQLIKPWVGRTVHLHLRAIESMLNVERGLSYYLFDSAFPYAPMCEATARLFVLWVICLYLYRKKIFIRI